MRDHWVKKESSDAADSPSTSSAARTLLPEPHPGFPGYRGPELLLEAVDTIVACLVEGCGIALEQARPIAVRLVVRLGDEHGGRFIWFPRRVPNASRLSWLVVTDHNRDFVEAVREHGPELAAAQFGFPLKRATGLAGKLQLEARAAAVCRIPWRTINGMRALRSGKGVAVVATTVQPDSAAQQHKEASCFWQEWRA